MNKEQANNILKLAMFLRSVPPHKFDMSNWVTGDPECLSKLDCGTTACAAGYLPMVFPNEWEWRGGFNIIHPTLKGYISTWISISTFFDLMTEDMEYLFGFMHKRTPQEEAAVLENYVREHYEDS